MARKTLDPAITTQAVESLFCFGVSNRQEANARLKSVDKPLARRLIASWLEREALTPAQGETLVRVVELLGLGDEREAFRRAALDPARGDATRYCAIRAILASEDLALLREISARLPPAQAASVARSALMELIARAEATDSGAELVATMLKSADEEHRPRVIEDIESIRHELGTSAASLYRKTLSKSGLGAIRKTMLAAIVEENAPEAVGLLQRCFETAPADDFRRDLQAALMRLRTRDISPVPVVRAAPAGHAFIGACDGQGALVVLGCFARSEKSVVLADVCFRLSEDVRDGFLAPRQTQQEVDQLLLDFAKGAQTRFVKVGLSQAAALVAAAVDRTRSMGRPIPEDVRPALARFAAISPKASEPLVLTSVEPRLEEVRALLSRPELGAWFFDRGDLESAGAFPPEEAPAWLAEAARKLDLPAVRARVTAMARFMAQWYAWDGDEQAAMLMHALAHQLERTFAESLLVRVMLESSRGKSVGTVSPEEAGVALVGDPEQRKDLRERFFSDVRRPRGRDLGLLDLTEVAREALERAMVLLQGAQRPRSEEIYTAGHALAGHFLESVLASTPDWPKTEAAMAEVLAKDWRLPRDTSKRVAQGCLGTLATFAADICDSCPVGCLLNPEREASQPFFATHHPSPRLRRDAPRRRATKRGVGGPTR